METLEASAIPRVRQGRHRGTYIEMLLSSALGLVASLVLSIDAVVLAANPDAVFSCDFSSTISCGTVAESWQAELLGFPNAFLGLMAEPVIITIAVASLGGVVFPRWFMRAAQVVTSIGFLFAYWLFYASYFDIGALCPWCLLITITTTLVFVAMTRVNILDGVFGERVRDRLKAPLSYHIDTVVAVLLLAVLAAMVIVRYV